MKRTRKNYSPEFKAIVVLELLQENKTINEIASKYGIIPKSLIEWKKQFLENAALAFDKSSVVKEYKQEIEKPKRRKWKISEKLGKVIVERDWLQGKLKSLDLLIRKTIIDNSEAIKKYGKPEIFNSDQGSQYTSKEHIEILEKRYKNINECKG